MANPSTQSNSSINAAKSKLEAALTRLEQAIDTRVAGAPDGSDLDKELTAAKAEISELKEKNKIVSTRLDGAINRMQEVLES